MDGEGPASGQLGKMNIWIKMTPILATDKIMYASLYYLWHLVFDSDPLKYMKWLSVNGAASLTIPIRTVDRFFCHHIHSKASNTYGQYHCVSCVFFLTQHYAGKWSKPSRAVAVDTLKQSCSTDLRWGEGRFWGRQTHWELADTDWGAAFTPIWLQALRHVSDMQTCTQMTRVRVEVCLVIHPPSL